MLLAGHQPQLFHPGVWFKNFVLSSLAEAHQAVAINLVIDSDTIKTAAIRVPSGTVDQPVLETVEFDRPGEEIPFEERPVEDERLFRSFGGRVARAIGPLVPHPLIDQLWPRAVARLGEVRNLGLCLAQARHQLEEAWGLETLELPQSALCRLQAFHWFTAHLLAHLPRFWDTYNRSLAEYRQVHGLRSKSHPVPDLAIEGDWLEAPFWIWSSTNPHRRHVFVRQQRDQIVLSDRAGLEIALDLTPEGLADRAVEQLAALESQGVKLRTRALVTTMFARLLLSDLFLHGIGGAKYDQLTDQLIRRFFDLRPPAFMTATATVRLPIAHEPIQVDALRRIDQTLRAFRYHPERHLDRRRVSAEQQRDVANWAEQKQAAVMLAKTPQNAHARHLAIQEANAALQPYLARQRKELLAARGGLEPRLRAERILASREYAFCLFPESSLRNLMHELS